jgi:hypothetical protein
MDRQAEGNDPLMRRPGEKLAAYLARLEALGPLTLSMAHRVMLVTLIWAAREATSRDPGSAGPQ